MAEEKVGKRVGGNKGQQDTKKGKPRSAGKSRGKIAGYYGSGRLAARKLRRVFKASGKAAARQYAVQNGLMTEWKKIVDSNLLLTRERAAERRRLRRIERSEAKLERARVRHEAERLAATEAAKKAKRSAAAKKAAATRAANKAAKLAAQAAENQATA